jgi:septal ring factor EnvC (AmiA/AmiB activator)
MGKKNKRSLKAELKRIRKNVEAANNSIDKVSKKTKKKNQKILKKMHEIIEEASVTNFGVSRALERMGSDDEDEEDIDQALRSSKKKRKKKGGIAIVVTAIKQHVSEPPTVDVDADEADVKPVALEQPTDTVVGEDASDVKADAIPTEANVEEGVPCPAPKKSTRKTKKVETA